MADRRARSKEKIGTLESRGGVDVKARQDPLRASYRTEPQKALITDRARTTGGVTTDPFHGQVEPGSEEYGLSWPFGIHKAVGGDHDLPNPGDILCAALATCLDSTIRIIANRLGVTLAALEVEVTAEVDVRGTLIVDREVPVGFQALTCHVKIHAAQGTDSGQVGKILRAAEHSCVVLQTLRSGVPVATSYYVS